MEHYLFHKDLFSFKILKSKIILPNNKTMKASKQKYFLIGKNCLRINHNLTFAGNYINIL